MPIRKILPKVIKFPFRLSLLIYIIFLFWQPKLPESKFIEPELKTHQPNQVPITQKPFTLTKGDIIYKLTPLYDYEIKGLVVSDYDSDDWLDVTHKTDPAQTKDLCLIWGKNLQNNIYRDLKYWHGEFTCFVKWTAEQIKAFDVNKLSNNHLIPANEGIAKQIKNSHIGDQVYIKGQLVNYEITDQEAKVVGTRNTSTIREDRDCEIIYVTEFQILQKPLLPYYTLKQYLPWIILITGLTYFIFWLS